jgi:hypothetical protein
MPVKLAAIMMIVNGQLGDAPFLHARKLFRLQFRKPRQRNTGRRPRSSNSALCTGYFTPSGENRRQERLARRFKMVHQTQVQMARQAPDANAGFPPDLNAKIYRTAIIHIN